MNNYEETLAFLTRMECLFYDYKWKAMAENDEKTYFYYENKILKVNEMKEFIREQYVNKGC